MPERFSNHAFDIDKSREQLLQEINELRESLTAKERRCLELSEENTCLARSLPEKEAFYQILYEHTPLAYQSLNAAGNLIAVNETWLSILGYTHEEVIGRNFADFLHPDCVEHFREDFHRFKSVGEILEVELEMVKKDGCLLLVSFDGKISRDNLGNFRQTHCIIQDITKRKRTEEDLRRYRQIVSFTPNPVSLVDRDYRYRIVNDAYETFSGRKREQLLGRHVAEYLGEEAFHSHVQPNFDRCLQGETIRYQAWFDYPALGRRFVDVTYFPYQEFDGLITGIVASTRDITDAKQVEEALRRSEARYRLLHESMRDGFVQVMMDGRIIDCNEVYCRMLGYSAEELRFLTYIHITPECWHDFEAAIVCDQILSRGFSDIYEKEYRRKDGTVFPAELRTILIRDNGGQPAAMWAIVRDITERKQAEEALCQSEERLQQALLVSRSMTFEWQLATDRVIRSDSCTSIMNFSGDEVIHDTGQRYFQRVHPDDRAQFVQIFNDLTPTANDYTTEYRIVRSDGTVVVLEEIGQATFDPKGKLERVVGVATDITKRKQVEDQLRVLNQELERRVENRTRELQESQVQVLHAEKLSAIGRLSASIAHEFNNPLQGIMTILKGLQKAEVLEEQDRFFLDLACSESERMKNLIGNLQDFNRPSSGRKVFMDVHATIDSLILLSKSDLKRKGVSTILNYDKALPQILAIPDQIKQVILNLLQNAADACDGSNGVITISTCHEGERIAVAIKDNGIGIAPDKLTQIFQPFFTTKSEIKGTGLGLSICHGIVQNHQGEIRVESEPGKGSTFTVLLPIIGEST